MGHAPTGCLGLSLSANRFKDNLEGEAGKLTTEQTVMNFGSSLRLPTATQATLGLSQNAAAGTPKTSLDNQTTTLSGGLSQPLGPHSLSANMQTSQFKDNNGVAHDLQTNTVGLSANLKLPRSLTASLGTSVSDTQDKVDGSTRKSNTLSASLGFPWTSRTHVQVWGSMIGSESDSLSAPADLKTTSLNGELTWAATEKSAYTLGLAQSKTADGVTPANDRSDLVVTFRLSYNF